MEQTHKNTTKKKPTKQKKTQNQTTQNKPAHQKTHNILTLGHLVYLLVWKQKT